MKLKNIEINDRPREKLINNGPASLSNSELLAIMLGSGTKEESILDLSSRLISEYGFAKLFRSSYSELKQIKGIKEAKACKLMALFEIARRVNKIDNETIPLKIPSDVYEYIKSDYMFFKTEMVSVIFVDKLSNVIGKKNYKSNDALRVSFPIKEIVAESINYKAYGIFVVHNHPSGDLTPSRSDIESTIELKQILNRLGIYLFDHLIISNNNYLSIFDKIKSL